MKVINLPDDLMLGERSSFKVYDYQTSSACVKQMVSLQQHIFSFLIEGSKEVFSDKTSISIEKSDFLLLKKGHCLMTEKLPNTRDGYRSILFFFSSESLLRFVKKHEINPSKDPDKKLIRSFAYDNFLKTFVNGLIDISKLNRKVQGKLLEIKFEELMIYLIETNGSNFIHALISNEDIQIQHFIEIIEANKLNKLTLKELSFLSHMSISTFKREFEKQYKSSPSRWFLEKRLEHSAFLLKNTTKRPSDIFEEVGYETLSNFIQAFKAKFGVTPKRYQLS
ncbi:MAG: AraC family transcriptional regulator [Bacteroidota bacterium]